MNIIARGLIPFIIAVASCTFERLQVAGSTAREAVQSAALEAHDAAAKAFERKVLVVEKEVEREKKVPIPCPHQHPEPIAVMGGVKVYMRDLQAAGMSAVALAVVIIIKWNK